VIEIYCDKFFRDLSSFQPTKQTSEIP